ncbi:DUF6203 family protein [Nonomuraea sp. MTCD27]|uniref:DUF6203 family protein n=1 Tax=Nonomuraea sp. MTCD27 TaxID=1676747 RepID=UPI0035C08B4B
MQKFLKLVVARWLARTPIGLVALGIGWYLARRRRRRQQPPHETQHTRRHPARTKHHAHHGPR